jgi:hypothetical protein
VPCPNPKGNRWLFLPSKFFRPCIIDENPKVSPKFRNSMAAFCIRLRSARERPGFFSDGTLFHPLFGYILMCVHISKKSFPSGKKVVECGVVLPIENSEKNHESFHDDRFKNFP